MTKRCFSSISFLIFTLLTLVACKPAEEQPPATEGPATVTAVIQEVSDFPPDMTSNPYPDVLLSVKAEIEGTAVILQLPVLRDFKPTEVASYHGGDIIEVKLVEDRTPYTTWQQFDTLGIFDLPIKVGIDAVRTHRSETVATKEAPPSGEVDESIRMSLLRLRETDINTESTVAMSENGDFKLARNDMGHAIVELVSRMYAQGIDVTVAGEMDSALKQYLNDYLIAIADTTEKDAIVIHSPAEANAVKPEDISSPKSVQILLKAEK